MLIRNGSIESKNIAALEKRVKELEGVTLAMIGQIDDLHTAFIIQEQTIATLTDRLQTASLHIVKLENSTIEHEPREPLVQVNIDALHNGECEICTKFAWLNSANICEGCFLDKMIEEL